MNFVSFWDKILIHESISFIPIFNLIIIVSLETNKSFFRELFVNLNLLNLNLGISRASWMSLSISAVKCCLAVITFKAFLEVVKWQIMKLSNNYKLRHLIGLPAQKTKLTESNISKFKEK